MMGLSYWLTLTVAAVFVKISTTSYKGFELLSITPMAEDHLEFLANLTKDYVELDIWVRPSLEDTGSLLVPPDILTEIKEALDGQNILWNVSNSDIDQLINQSPGLVAERKPAVAQDSMTPTGHVKDGINHTSYHKLHTIVQYLKQLQDLYPDFATVSTLNYTTFENRHVFLLRLSSNTSAPSNSKPSIIIESGIHAREWIAPASTLYVIDHMIKSYAQNEAPGRSMLDKYDWYFVPVANPDGYEYTQVKRLWRKNRRRISRRCTGVDANRNFNFHFGTTGVSVDCTSEVYPGNVAFSEAETSNLRDLFWHLQQSLVSYLSIHSFGQVLLIPWQHSRFAEKPKNYNEIYRVAELMKRSMGTSHGTVYRAGLATKLMYEASGVSIDWALSQKPNLYAISLELRPNYASFTLPETEIVPTGTELLAALKTLSDEMREGLV